MPSRYSSLEVAELFVRYRLSTCLVPPLRSREISKLAGRLVLFAALSGCDGACEIIGGSSEVQKFLAHFNRDPDLARSLSGAAGSCAKYLCKTDGDQFRLVNRLVGHESAESHESCVLLNLEAMGRTVARRAARPLVAVHLDGGPAEQQVRLLTKCHVGHALSAPGESRN